MNWTIDKFFRKPVNSNRLVKHKLQLRVVPTHGLPQMVLFTGLTTQLMKMDTIQVLVSYELFAKLEGFSEIDCEFIFKSGTGGAGGIGPGDDAQDYISPNALKSLVGK